MDCASYPAYAVTLSCGVILHYRSRAHVPGLGEQVPCLRHVQCSVISPGRRAALPDSKRRRQRTPRRTCTELARHLDSRQAATIAELRRLRFTMRLIVDAARDGLVSVTNLENDGIVRRADSRS